MKNRLFMSRIILAASITSIAAASGCSASEPKLDYDNKTNVTDVEEQVLTEKINDNLASPSKIQASLSICHDIEDLKAEKIVQIVRFNYGRYYSVTPVEDGKYLFLLYSDKERCNGDSIYVVDGYLTASFANKENFNDIEARMSKEKILMKDPNAYVFENLSYHRFSDQSVLEFEYDADKNIVSEYYYYYPADYKEDPYRESVVDYLLPKDIELIS